jgi:hypothetical protein
MDKKLFFTKGATVWVFEDVSKLRMYLEKGAAVAVTVVKGDGGPEETVTVQQGTAVVVALQLGANKLFVLKNGQRVHPREEGVILDIGFHAVELYFRGEGDPWPLAPTVPVDKWVHIQP